MNAELAQELVNEIGGGKTKFFEANVLETESIAVAVKGALAWSKETGKEIGGVIAAAGVSTPAKVRLGLITTILSLRSKWSSTYGGSSGSRPRHNQRMVEGWRKQSLLPSLSNTYLTLTLSIRFLTVTGTPLALTTSTLS